MRQLKITKSITSRDSASLDKYLQEIGREGLLTVDEEVELTQRIKKGDRRALLPRNSMRPVVSSSSPTLYGGFAKPSCRLWRSRAVLYASP